MASNQGGSSEVLDNVARPPIWCRNRSPKPGSTTPRLLQADTGRTIEQVLLLNFSTGRKFGLKITERAATLQVSLVDFRSI